MKLRGFVSVVMVWVVAALMFGPASKATGAEEIKFQMGWLYSGLHAPFLIARDKGFYKKYGLNVKILPGRGAGKAAINVDTKQVEYTYVDYLTMVKLISKGGKNRAIGVGTVFQGAGFISLEEAGITSPKDLEGKRLGAPSKGLGVVLLPALAAGAGIDLKKIIIKTMKPSVRTPALFKGQIDFITGLRGSSVPRMAVHAKKRGRKTHVVYFKDMGLDTYGYVIQTHQDRITQNPDEVQSLVSAAFAAFAWSIKNPKEALDVYSKAVPQKDREISRLQLVQVFSDVQDPETKHLGLGYMKESLTKKTVDIANKYFKLSPNVNYKMTYTNRFIKKNP